MNWMIYGANGYTGKLIAEAAAQAGERPILAGRRVSAVVPLATKLGCDHRIFSLDNVQDAAAALAGVDVVLHCAGPFSATSMPMLQAAMASGTHYLDITGEIAVFESIFQRAPELRRAGIVAIPGVGFDVVPTDCMAAMLSRALPSGTRLELGFVPLGGGLSHGTARSALEGVGEGGAARIQGRIKRVPHGWRRRGVEIGGRTHHLMSVPWGDVSTAYHSTGIPNITVYTAFPQLMIRAAPLAGLTTRVLANAWVQRALAGLVDRHLTGPSEQARQSGATLVWGRVEDDQGQWAEGTLSAAEGYLFTVRSALVALARLKAQMLPPGAYTPSLAWGPDFVKEVEGTAVDPIRQGAQ